MSLNDNRRVYWSPDIGNWHHYYKAFVNPTSNSEKIADINLGAYTNITLTQLWALGQNE